jgi:hypothetical protein
MTYYLNRELKCATDSKHCEFATIQALIHPLGFYLCDDDLHELMYNHFYNSSIPEFATCGMLIKEYQDIIDARMQYNTQFSRNSLFNTVKRIDRIPNRFGFLSENILKKECELIVPEVVNKNNNIYQYLFSLKILRTNMYHLQFPMIAPALLLLLIKSFIFNNKALRTVNWSNMIYILINAPLDSIEYEVNEEIIRLHYTIKNDEEE